MNDPVFDVTGAVAVLNQTLEYAYPTITIVGEVSQFQVSKGKWVYFDIKDDQSKLKCFASVWQLRMPIEDGMLVELVARPRLHNLYGFSLNVEAVRPSGEGSLKKAADLLKAKLEAAGLFDASRKRILPYPPECIALVASGESAAYADFIKIIQARWPFVEIEHHEVQVQGRQAEDDIVAALQQINEDASRAQVVVLIRGGGSADDLSAFSTEPVVKAVAASRIPTMVAIGHEVDVSLAELAADVRASTPSNAAELLVPDRRDVLARIQQAESFLGRVVGDEIMSRKNALQDALKTMQNSSVQFFILRQNEYKHARLRLESYHPKQVLKRGYGLVRVGGRLYRPGLKLSEGAAIQVELEQVVIDATVQRIEEKT